MDETHEESASPQPRFVDRLWALRALIAVALASVIIGGVGGAAIAKTGEGQSPDRGGPGGNSFRGGPGGGPPGVSVPPPATGRRH